MSPLRPQILHIAALAFLWLVGSCSDYSFGYLLLIAGRNLTGRSFHGNVPPLPALDNMVTRLIFLFSKNNDDTIAFIIFVKAATTFLVNHFRHSLESYIWVLRDLFRKFGLAIWSWLVLILLFRKNSLDSRCVTLNLALRCQIDSSCTPLNALHFFKLFCMSTLGIFNMDYPIKTFATADI